ncbi:hypothetical protein BLNAU_8870 [Blattamonas nauphoetae]|uniref:Uncharacterized protein n=1 Tax=Blattamonas nauphoetae TaxID=2049346 RepID=A0ABQ9XXA3_9EUKA|nr:hypothetical protein BLNAU_8870 [Blattamonas nauphoetae]
MDSLMISVLEEIGIKGRNGIVLSQLFLSLGIQDTSIKRFIWLQLLQTPNLTITNKANQNRPVTSPDEYNETQICIFGDKSIFDPALGMYDPSINLTTSQRNILKEIAQTKDKGILQSAVSHTFKLDPRNTFHHLRSLIGYGLVIRRQSTSQNSNILFLPRWHNQNSIDDALFPTTFDDGSVTSDQTDLFNQSFESYLKLVCTFLQTQPNQCAADDFIRQYFNLTIQKWQNIRATLLGARYCLQIKSKPTPESSLVVPLLKLVRPYEESQKPNLVIELPLLYQLYATIWAARNIGIRQTDLVKLCYNPRRGVTTALTQLMGHFNVIGIRETVGKLTTYRLFCRDFLPAEAMELENMIVALEPDEDQDEETGDRSDIAPIQKKKRTSSTKSHSGGKEKKNQDY